ncbi:MAG: helix-turn-helix domain-containing protein [Synergistaceae bacterium]|nr:helix-turn-helix domain-containing protein [Synergistaceae bacterium]
MGLEDTGKSIAQLRKKAGLTQRELADYLGISDKAVSKWERGLSFPDISCLEMLSTLLDTDTDSLLAGAPAHSRKWTGVLLLDDDSLGGVPGIDTVIYDKPMIFYLLSYFMLAGISSMHVICSDNDRDVISAKIGVPERLGISLDFSVGKNFRRPDGNIMLVAGRRLLYGRGLTRCFKLAMTRRNQFTLLSLMKKNDDDSKRIDFDITMKVSRIGFRHHKRKTAAQYYIPFLFIPEGMRGFKFPVSVRDFTQSISDMAMKKQLCTEVLDRGFLEFGLDSWEAVSDASNFVRLAQNMSGMSVCSLEEIAWRRGFIPENRA